jgi:hypothetical protein
MASTDTLRITSRLPRERGLIRRLVLEGRPRDEILSAISFHDLSQFERALLTLAIRADLERRADGDL